MRITVYISATLLDDAGQWRGGRRAHIITLSNEDALDRLIEHFQGKALDNVPLAIDDCLVYDDKID